MEEKNGIVTLVVTMEEELLRRVNASLHPNLAAEDIAKVEEGLHFITNNELGEQTCNGVMTRIFSEEADLRNQPR